MARPAVAVGLAAVALGPVVPGVGRAAVDVHAFGVSLDVSRVELNPLVDIRPQLLTSHRTELFTVRAPAPAYWRLTSLDRFDGRRWSPSRPALFRHDGSGGELAAASGDRALHQDFWLTGLDSPWLPAAGRAVRVTAAGARLDPESDSLVTRRGSRAVRAYRVESRLPEAAPAAFVGGTPPGPRALEPDGKVSEGAAGRPSGLARYLALPSRFPAEVRELAQRFTAGAATPYDRALALRDSLRVGFIYDETAPAGASSDALDHFLFGSHRGYCEQFAGAYAAMARAVGLPARVAVGFTPGTYDGAAGVWRVTTREAHAWPEVFLDGIGWTAFEPTPGRVLPGPGDRLRLDTPAQLAAAARPSGGRGGPLALTRVDPGGAAGLDAGPGGRAGGLAGAVTHPNRLWWLGLGALGLVALPPAAKTRRRRRRRRARADEAVLAAWAEALDRLGEAGLPRRTADTPREFARRAGRVRPGLAPAISRLAELVNGAAYGAEGGTGAGAEAWAAAGQVVRALDAHDPGWERWRRRLDPRPLRLR
jgi:transglutaminase-like putative cysteine protease